MTKQNMCRAFTTRNKLMEGNRNGNMMHVYKYLKNFLVLFIVTYYRLKLCAITSFAAGQ